MHEILPISCDENHWNCCHHISDVTAKMHKIRFWLGSLQHSPGPLAGFKLPTSKGGEGRNSELLHWSVLKNTIVVVLTVYISIAVRNNMYFVLYHYCCEGRYSVNIHFKCQGEVREKLGNLITTGDWPPLATVSMVKINCDIWLVCHVPRCYVVGFCSSLFRTLLRWQHLSRSMIFCLL